MEETTIKDRLGEIYNKLPEGFTVDDIISFYDEIKSISEECQTMPFFKKSEKSFKEYIESIEKEISDRKKRIIYSWNHLDDKVANAPTYYHAVGAMILCVPILEHFLKYYLTHEQNAINL